MQTKFKLAKGSKVLWGKVHRNHRTRKTPPIHHYAHKILWKNKLEKLKLKDLENE